MTTTDHPSEVRTELAIDLTEARERRATSLLERRDELGSQWAEALSHHLPNAEDLAYEIAFIEQAVERCHPSVFDERFSEWVARDAALLHVRDMANPSCSMCASARQSPGVA